MNRVHVIGGKNHGKTTLVVELVQAFTALGLRVGTIKHTHHQHELDAPGKDSHRHRESGATVVGICSPSMNAVFWPPMPADDSTEDESELKYVAFAPMFERCDLVLVEGNSGTRAFKVEVWRRDLGAPPIAQQDPSVAAVITDDTWDGNLTVPCWRRSDVDELARNILRLKHIRV